MAHGEKSMHSSSSWVWRWPLRTLRHSPIWPTDKVLFPWFQTPHSISSLLTPSPGPLPNVASLLLSLVDQLFFLFYLNSNFWWWHRQAVWLRQWATISTCKPSLFKKLWRKNSPSLDSFYVAMLTRQTREGIWGSVRSRALGLFSLVATTAEGEKIKGLCPAVLKLEALTYLFCDQFKPFPIIFIIFLSTSTSQSPHSCSPGQAEPGHGSYLPDFNCPPGLPVLLLQKYII